MEQPHDTSNRLTGSEKDKLRKKFGHNRLSGAETDFGRKKKELAKKHVPKHYRGNTNSEGGIPFGKKP